MEVKFFMILNLYLKKLAVLGLLFYLYIVLLNYL